MIINEDFWDEHSVEKDDERVIDVKYSNEENPCRFELDIYQTKYGFSTKSPIITADIISSTFKKYIHYIRNSSVFTSPVIESLRISINWDSDYTEDSYFNKSLKDYMDELPKDIFGIPVSLSVEDNRNTISAVIHLYIDFTAGISFKSPKELDRFFNMMYPKFERMKTYLNIIPLYTVPEYRAKHMTFFIGHIEDDNVRMLKGAYENGASYQLTFDDNKVNDYNFKFIYWLLLDVRFLKRFHEYIIRNDKTSEYPLSDIVELLSA